MGNSSLSGIQSSVAPSENEKEKQTGMFPKLTTDPISTDLNGNSKLELQDEHSDLFEMTELLNSISVTKPTEPNLKDELAYRPSHHLTQD